MKPQTELAVALDFSTVALAEKLISDLRGLPVIYKVGLELFLSAGPDWVKRFASRGNRIFLDLKFHDIPNTVAKAVIQASGLGAEFTTIHLSGGKDMLNEIEIQMKQAEIATSRPTSIRVLGVTVLTSFKEEAWIANVSNTAKLTAVRPLEDAVMHFASLAASHPAVSGIVCSAKEVSMIREKHKDLYLMVPGIRNKGESTHDQSRVMTPAEAMAAGASAIVVGRPITQAADPRQVTESILKEISHE